MITNVCGDCAGPVSTKKSLLCRACWMKHHQERVKRPRCVDCGNFASYVRKNQENPKRCRPCHILQLKAHPPKLQRIGCSVEGCTRKHKAHGLCRTHYKAVLFRERRPWSGAKRHVMSLPCCICGYDKMRSHVHRLGHWGGYEWGRIIPVCQRCHDEIISGITPEPETGVPCPPDWVEARQRPARTASNATTRPISRTPTE
jgi:hypothetical protein